MAEPGRRQAPALSALLLARPDDFDGYQALRLLSRIAREEPAALRLRGNTSLSCPSGGLAQVDKDGVAGTLTATLNYLTLSGANGPLPPPFSDEINARLRAGDTALRDFLDIFVDRLAKLDFDRAQLFRPELSDLPADESNLALPLLALLGMATAGMAQKTRPNAAIPTDSILALAPLLHREPLSAHALEQAVTAWSGLPARVRPFRGDWILLPRSQCTRIQRDKGNNRLGEDAMLGTAAWDPMAGITIELGPMPLARAEQLLPGGREHRPLAELIDRMTDAVTGVALVLRLISETVPPARLPAAGLRARAPRLGWTSKLAGSSSAARGRGRPARITLRPGWIASALP
ncbi:type VI secretion system baseplate subunit TssG [Sphingomonas sp. 37zxx]|uniref:type VI secretion system baseplate subunit TssG n=1 Tax=Sphingomonas sp. 37zxx TaxID=1550073 RepID=UPI00053BFE14|nr:type VI secretion system baseplate subunit TssG [Sphingomonas sp. 37zxx]